MRRMPFARRALVTSLAAALGFATLALPTARAITFERLDATGNVVGIYTPAEGDWVFADGSRSSDLTALAGGGFSLLLDPDSFGLGEDTLQRSDIFGAGILLPASAGGYRVSFSANLRTWDAYNDGIAVPPLPDSHIGFWDLFAVNANTSNYYWNLVDRVGSEGGGEELPGPAAIGPGGLVDSLVPTPPAGSLVQYTNDGSNPAALPGATWAWGGRDYAAGYFESIRTNGSVQLATNQAVFVSFVLDTATVEQADQNYPSWGAFGRADAFVDVPDGEEGEPPGWSPGNPLLPVDGNVEDGVFEFAPFDITAEGPGGSTFLFIDPVIAIGYEYTVSGGPKFLEILLPTLGDADGYDIELLVSGDWQKVGEVAEGGTFTFAEAVSRFRVMGIDPDLELDPTNPVAFVTGVKFDGTGTVQLTMEAVTAPIPEPQTYALFAAGLALLAARRARRATR